jgi:biotin-(acetyl-CoA carboxylase) ligase
LRRIEERYLGVNSADSAAGSAGKAMLASWSANLVTLGRRVRVASGDKMIEGRAESVDASGSLLIRTNDGLTRRITVGDVSLEWTTGL